jgi:energy-coupling factor transporter ATP-binding protein EcfA2
MRIRIADYQALADVDLEAMGLTVITGPSNIGKSAILRAITGAVFGRSGDYYIRNGQHSTSVEIDDSGLELKWTKTNRPTSSRQTALQVNGVVHTKLGREHWKLTECLGMYGIDTTYTQFRPQFAEQGSPPFLLMENDTVVAELMKKVARADVTTKATALAKKDATDTNQRAKTRKEDLIAAQALLDELNGLPQLLDRHNRLTKDYQPATVPTSPPSVAAPSSLRHVGLLERLAFLVPVSIPTEPSFVQTPTEVLNRIHNISLLKALNRQIEATNLEVDGLVGDLETIDSRKKELEKELRTCPTCERPFHEHA